MYSSETDFRIEVAYQDPSKDPAAHRVREQLRSELGKAIRGLEVIDVYMLHLDISDVLAKRIADDVCTDRIIQHSAINGPLIRGHTFFIERKFLPGVTDTRANILREQIELLLGRPLREGEWVQTAIAYVLSAGDEKHAQAIARAVGNPLIHQVSIYGKGKWPWMSPPPVLAAKKEAFFDVVNLDFALTGPVDKVIKETGMTYWSLLALGKDALAAHGLARRAATDDDLRTVSERFTLALSVAELKSFRDYFVKQAVARRRKAVGLAGPTDVELEAFAQTQSEHCKHKIFNASITLEEGGKKTLIESIFKTYIRAATQAVHRTDLRSVFSDNAGIISFDKDTIVGFKVETHNAPSALDPFGGAETGIVGVNRDILGAGLGLMPLANTDVFCLGNPFHKGPLPSGILHPFTIFEGVRSGVESGGNKSGIPTVNGAYAFDESFLCRPLVFAGTIGIAPAKVAGKNVWQKRAKPGHHILMVGGRVGLDGIHGATFSSAGLDEQSSTSAVQIGDPITQKKMGDALLEARDKGLIESVTDNGAGGLSSSVGEMALQAGGCEIDLAKVPLKYDGLAPWQILVSESQERMTVAVSAQNVGDFLHLLKSRGVEGTDIGEFTSSGVFHIRHGQRTVGYIDLEFLHDGLPPLQLQARLETKKEKKKTIRKPALSAALLAVLSDLNVCSKEYTIRQYDHEVKAMSVVKPLVGLEMDGPSDAAVLKPKENSWKGLVVSCGLAPSLSEYDAYQMALCAVDEAVRNAVCVGADPSSIVLLDNFCWPDPIFDEKENPDGKHKLAQLVFASRGLFDAAKALRMPFISGKDSMKNDFRYVEKNRTLKRSIQPTVLISALGTMHDVRAAQTMDVKCPGDVVYVVGMTRDALKGTRYDAQFEVSSSDIPRVNLEESRDVFAAISRAIEKGLVNSCHDCSEGGLAVALAESAFAGMLGMTVDCAGVPREGKLDERVILFGESPARFVVTVPAGKESAFESMVKGVPFASIGKVTQSPFLAIKAGKSTVRFPLAKLKKEWQKPFGGLNGSA